MIEGRGTSPQDEGLAYFGKVTSSISHEIKGHLATLKEEAGLATDLLALAERGRPLDPAQITSLLRSIAARADAIDEVAKCLSLVAHSVDDPCRTFDAADLVALVVRLCRRPAASRRVTLEVAPDPCHVPVTGDQFQLQRLLCLAVEETLGGAGEGGRICADVQNRGGAACFLLTGTFAAPRGTAESIAGHIGNLRPRVGVEVIQEKDRIGVLLALPKASPSP